MYPEQPPPPVGEGRGLWAARARFSMQNSPRACRLRRHTLRPKPTIDCSRRGCAAVGQAPPYARYGERHDADARRTAPSPRGGGPGFMGGTRAVPDAKFPACVSAAPPLALRTASAIACAPVHHPGEGDDFAVTATRLVCNFRWMAITQADSETSPTKNADGCRRFALAWLTALSSRRKRRGRLHCRRRG